MQGNICPIIQNSPANSFPEVAAPIKCPKTAMAEIGCPLLGDGKYGRGEVNRSYHEQKQCLWSYRLAFDFKSDAGLLEYLRGKVFQVENIPFKIRYFS